jgi:hypothetical protein
MVTVLYADEADIEETGLIVSMGIEVEVVELTSFP